LITSFKERGDVWFDTESKEAEGTPVRLVIMEKERGTKGERKRERKREVKGSTSKKGSAAGGLLATTTVVGTNWKV